MEIFACSIDSSIKIYAWRQVLQIIFLRAGLTNDLACRQFFLKADFLNISEATGYKKFK